jgi:hypothetical protein
LQGSPPVAQIARRDLAECRPGELVRGGVAHVDSVEIVTAAEHQPLAPVQICAQEAVGDAVLEHASRGKSSNGFGVAGVPRAVSPGG